MCASRIICLSNVSSLEDQETSEGPKLSFSDLPLDTVTTVRDASPSNEWRWRKVSSYMLHLGLVEGGMDTHTHTLSKERGKWPVLCCVLSQREQMQCLCLGPLPLLCQYPGFVCPLWRSIKSQSKQMIFSSSLLWHATLDNWKISISMWETVRYWT